MTFPREQPVTAVSIRDIGITLTDLLVNGSSSYEAAYSIQVRMSDGSTVVRKGNLIPHLTTAQRDGLIDFMEAMRTKAEAELLPE